MSKRYERLKARGDELRRLEHLAQIRLSNAERGLSGINADYGMRKVAAAFREEVELARKALRDVHDEQQLIIEEIDRHTTNMPDGALILVDDPAGPRIIERRDPNNTGTDETDWYDLGAPESDRPMTFDVAIGADDGNPGGHGFYRIYTQDEVDDFMDQRECRS